MLVGNKGFEIKESKGTEVCVFVCLHIELVGFQGMECGRNRGTKDNPQDHGLRKLE